MKKLFVLAAAVTAAALLAGCTKKAAPDNSLEELKSRGEFVLGLDDSFPPMGFRNETDEIVGFDIDLAKEVAARLGVNFRAQPINWDAKEQELATGNIDCIWNGLTITEDRLASLSFTKPYLNNAQVLVVRKDAGIEKLEDLAGKTVGIQAGSSAADALDAAEDFKKSLKDVVEFKDNILALNDLEIGGVDGVVMDLIVANYAIATSGKPFSVLAEGLAPEEYGVAFRKNDVKLTDAVQKTLEEMKADGTVEKISTKWFGSDITVIGQ